jgi:hypothetical protein
MKGLDVVLSCSHCAEMKSWSARMPTVAPR